MLLLTPLNSYDFVGFLTTSVFMVLLPQPMKKNNAIQIYHNDVFHKHMKHIVIDYHIHQHINLGTVHLLLYINSNDQFIDLFAKAHMFD